MRASIVALRLPSCFAASFSRRALASAESVTFKLFRFRSESGIENDRVPRFLSFMEERVRAIFVPLQKSASACTATAVQEVSRGVDALRLEAA